MPQNHLITGPPGAGKTALIAELRARGFDCVDEPARRVLAEQRKVDGKGVPNRDPALFTELMLTAAVEDFQSRRDGAQPVFFDRGVPDIVAYARLFGIDDRAALAASNQHRYRREAFFAPPWSAIYCQDDERKMTFGEARAFGDLMRAAYREAGYVLVELPLGPTAERADFVVDRLSDR